MCENHNCNECKPYDKRNAIEKSVFISRAEIIASDMGTQQVRPVLLSSLANYLYVKSLRVGEYDLAQFHDECVFFTAVTQGRYLQLKLEKTQKLLASLSSNMAVPTSLKMLLILHPIAVVNSSLCRKDCQLFLIYTTITEIHLWYQSSLTP